MKTAKDIIQSKYNEIKNLTGDNPEDFCFSDDIIIAMMEEYANLTHKNVNIGKLNVTITANEDELVKRLYKICEQLGEICDLVPDWQRHIAEKHYEKIMVLLSEIITPKK